MEKSKVYFTDFRAKLGEGLPMKLKRLLKKAGISEIDMENKFVAIKMHFGELGNISFLRPNYAKQWQAGFSIYLFQLYQSSVWDTMPYTTPYQ